MSKYKKKNDPKHSRAPGMTQISISLPRRLVEKVDRLAHDENRSRSNYIAYILDRLPEEHSIAFLQSSDSQRVS